MQTNDFSFQKHLPANQYSTLSAQSQTKNRFLTQKNDLCGRKTNGRRMNHRDNMFFSRLTNTRGHAIIIEYLKYPAPSSPTERTFRLMTSPIRPTGIRSALRSGILCIAAFLNASCASAITPVYEHKEGALPSIKFMLLATSRSNSSRCPPAPSRWRSTASRSRTRRSTRTGA